MRHIQILKALVEGKKVQVRTDSGKWADMSSHLELEDAPSFSDLREYRIKPGNKKFRVAQTNNGVTVANTEEYASWLFENPCFKRWLTDWIEYEE